MSFELQHMSSWLHTACETSSCNASQTGQSRSVTFMSSTGCRSSGAAALLQIYRLTNVLNKKNTCQSLCMSVLWWLMCVKYGITAESDDDFQCCLLQPRGGSDWSIPSPRKPWRQDSIPLCLSSVLSLLTASVHHLLSLPHPSFLYNPFLFQFLIKSPPLNSSLFLVTLHLHAAVTLASYRCSNWKAVTELDVWNEGLPERVCECACVFRLTDFDSKGKGLRISLFMLEDISFFIKQHVLQISFSTFLACLFHLPHLHNTFCESGGKTAEKQCNQ